MKQLCVLMIISLLLFAFSGCTEHNAGPQIAATTLPVYEFTTILCENTGLSVGRLITENVSCLHDYTLQVSQMRMIESADTIVISGVGLESFLDEALNSAKNIIDASRNAHLNEDDDHHGDHNDHHHETDPHIWLSPENAMTMAENICLGLSSEYPQHKLVFEKNLGILLTRLSELQAYGTSTLSNLSCRKIITFHDGFSYFAESFDLNILRAIEEESGSEASAAELRELICLVEFCELPAIFIEENGSVSAADIISAETGTSVYTLSMAMSGNSYFEAMYHNIDTIKEALE